MTTLERLHFGVEGGVGISLDNQDCAKVMAVVEAALVRNVSHDYFCDWRERKPCRCGQEALGRARAALEE